jgi:hypothetical protein
MPWAELSDTKRPSRSGIDNADPALPVFGHIADGTAETEVRYRKRRCMPRVEPRLSYTLRPEGHAPLLMYKFCPGRQQSGSQQRLFFRAHSHKSQKRLCSGVGSCLETPENRSSTRRCTYTQASGSWESRKAIFQSVVKHRSGESRLFDHFYSIVAKSLRKL